MSQKNEDTPSLWIVAGPNGSSKSTFYHATGIVGFRGTVWIINPDLLAKRIREQEILSHDEANRAALDRIQAWLGTSTEAYQTVGVKRFYQPQNIAR